MKPAQTSYNLELFFTSFPQRRLAEWYRWEFLRRNSEFQSDYANFIKIHGKWLSRHGHWNDEDSRVRWTKSQENYYFKKIAPEILRICIKWRISDLDSPATRFSKRGKPGHESEYASHPATGIPPELNWDFELMRDLIGLGFTGRGGSARRKGHLLLIEFDLTWPLKDQLDGATRILQRAQESYTSHLRGRGHTAPLRRRRFEDYDNHLKAWDLSKRGQDATQIGRQLFPHDHGDSVLQKVRDHLAAAQRLISGQYAEIR
jgi:hypothetical protein